MARPPTSLAFSLGAAAGAALASTVLLWNTHRKVTLLQDLDLHLHSPGVPQNVLDAVRGAEMTAYRRMPTARKVVEDGQDMAGLLWPQAVYRANYSVGAFRIKSRTAAEVIDFAIERGLLELRVDRDARYIRMLPVLAQQPALNTWFAGVLLMTLRERHPMLRGRDWDDIAADPDAIAKLYSGYTGAGGAWDAWAADEVPGPVARERLGYDPETGAYAGIRPARS